MARSQSPGDLRDFFEEFEDIRSSKRQEDDDEETSKTPDGMLHCLLHLLIF